MMKRLAIAIRKSRKKNPQPREDTAEVISDGGGNGVGGIAGATF